MNRALWLLVTSVVAVACRSQDRWQPYTSARGGFAIQVPRAVQTSIDSSAHRKEDEEADGGVRVDAAFVAEESRAVRDEDGVYTVRWYEVPLTASLSDRDFLERLVATRKLGPSVVPRWIHLGPYAGIEYERIEPAQDRLVRARVFVVEGRVFHLWVDNWISRDDEVAAHRFLDSFELNVAPELNVTYDGVVAERR